jgi:hypothetical protein
MRYLGPAIALLGLWLGARAGVRAEPAPAPVFAIEVHGDVSFARAELEDALLPRLRDASIEIRAAAHGATAHVSAHDDGVHVKVGPRQRVVPLGERTGADAARVVALVILDLLPSEGPALPMPLPIVPAAEPDTQPETQPDMRPGIQQNTRPETQPGTRTDTRTDTQPGTRTETKPDDRPETQPDARPSARPDTRPDTRPDMGSSSAPAPAVGRADAGSAAATRPALAFEPQRTAPGPVPPPPPPPPPLRVAPQAAPGPAPHLARPAVPPPGAAPAAWNVRVSAFGGVVRGTDSDHTDMVSAGADARLGLGAWRAGAGAAWVHVPTLDRGQAELGLHGLSLRVEAGRALGGVELTTAAFVMPYRLRADVDGGASLSAVHDSVLFGGGVAARATAELGRDVGLYATAGVDVFGRRVRVRTPEDVLASTPAVALSIHVGLSWEVFP